MRAAQQEKTPTGHLIGFVGRTVAEVERDLITETLKFCHVLGISIRALRDKLNDYAAGGVELPPSNGEPRAVA